MREIIEAEQQLSDTESRPRPQRKKNSKRKCEMLSDSEDEPYTSSGTSDSESGSEHDITEITAEEVGFVPPHFQLHQRIF
jgi:hypothetical protein